MAALCAAWKQRGLSPDTRYSHHAQLRIVLRMLGRPELKEAVPKMRYPNSHPPTATPEEIARLITVAPPFLRAAIIFARDTGLRRGDLLELAEDNITGETIRLKMKKTGRQIELPISPAMHEVLRSLPPGDTHSPILERIHQRKMQTWIFERAWNKAKKQAGVNPKLKPHSLRHTVAVSIYEVSRDIRVVQEVLGHQSLSSTVRYLEHSDPGKLRPLLEQMWTPKGKVQ